MPLLGTMRPLSCEAGELRVGIAIAPGKGVPARSESLKLVQDVGRLPLCLVWRDTISDKLGRQRCQFFRISGWSGWYNRRCHGRHLLLWRVARRVVMHPASYFVVTGSNNSSNYSYMQVRLDYI